MGYRRMIQFTAAAAVALVVVFPAYGAMVATAAPAQATMRVEVDDNYFAPKTLTVPAGTTVVWKSEGHHEHTVTADNGAFSSDDLHTDDTFTHTFATPGTFAYHCKYHGAAGGVGMAATIVVTAVRSGGQPATLPNTGAGGERWLLLAGLALCVGILGFGLRQHTSHVRE